MTGILLALPRAEALPRAFGSGELKGTCGHMSLTLCTRKPTLGMGESLKDFEADIESQP